MLSKGDRRGRCSGSGEGRWFVVMGDLERCNSSMVGGFWCMFSADGLEVLWTPLSVGQREGQSVTPTDAQGREPHSKKGDKHGACAGVGRPFSPICVIFFPA